MPVKIQFHFAFVWPLPSESKFSNRPRESDEGAQGHAHNSYTTPPVVEAVPFMPPQAQTHSSSRTVAIETNHSVLPSNPSAFQLGAEIVSNPGKSSWALPANREAPFDPEHKIPVLKIKKS